MIEQLEERIDDLETQLKNVGELLMAMKSIAANRSEAMTTWAKERREGMKPFTHSIYGWKKEDGNLVPDWEQQEVISEMKEMLEEGKSGGEIARLLNTIGIQGAKGGTWHSNSVYRTVRNEFHKNLKKFTLPK